MPFLIFLLGIGAFIVSVVYMLAKVFTSLAAAPGSRQWNQIIGRLRSSVQPLTAQLIPWDGKDILPLLSVAELKAKGGWLFQDNTQTGVIETIYQEPVVAISAISAGKSKIMMARTSNREFVFQTKPKEIAIWVDGQPFAVLAGGALLSAGKNAQLLAQVEGSSDNRQIPVRIGNQTAFTVANTKALPESPIPRALTPLRDFNEQEELIVLALTILSQYK